MGGFPSTHFVKTDMECFHFTSTHFSPSIVENQIKKAYEAEFVCSICKVDTESKWICLGCGVISCGRYVKGHALEHYKTTGHQLALDIESKACHWYDFQRAHVLFVCSYIDDEYIVAAGKYESELEKLRKTITDILAGLETTYAFFVIHS